MNGYEKAEEHIRNLEKKNSENESKYYNAEEHSAKLRKEKSQSDAECMDMKEQVKFMLEECLRIRSYISRSDADVKTVDSMIESNLLGKFQQFQPESGDQYDTNEHKLAKPSEEESHNFVITELKVPGYKLKGNIIIKAEVIVERQDNGGQQQ